MKITHPNNKTKILLTSALTVAVLLACAGYYVFAVHGSILGWTPYPKKDSSGTNSPSTAQINNGANIKQQSIDDSKTKTNSSGSDHPPSPVPQPNGKSTVEVTITAVNQTDTTLQIRSLISTLDLSGSCTLKLQKEGASPVTQTVGVQSLTNTTTCKGFNIPIDQLPSGTWQASLLFDSTSYTGNTSQTITIK